MNDARRALIEIVSDEGRAPANILGAAISFARMQGSDEERRLANAADEAVLRELKLMAAERGGKF